MPVFTCGKDDTAVMNSIKVKQQKKLYKVGSSRRNAKGEIASSEVHIHSHEPYSPPRILKITVFHFKGEFNKHYIIGEAELLGVEGNKAEGHTLPQ